MPDRDGGGSKWSGAREREERQRQRAMERERTKQERLARESGQPPPESDRRLTDEERRTIREFRFPTPDETATPRQAPGAYPLPGGEQVESGTAIGRDAERPSTANVSTRWRDSVAGGSGDSGSNGAGLPDLPGDDGGQGRSRPGNARLVIFGAALLVAMAAIYFLPFRPFGGGDDNGKTPPPTSNTILPSIFNTPESGASDGQPGTQPEQVAQAGQPIVCIDPGHGGWDTGWNRTDQEGQDTGPYGPPIVTEAQLNLGMAYMLKADLEAMGYFVVLTRPSGAAVNMFDEDVNGDGETRLEAKNTEQAGARDELQARINVCNDAGADILVSVHIDGFSDSTVRGFQVFYTVEREFGEKNAELATLIYRQMTSASEGTDMENTGAGARPDTDIENERYESGTADHFIMTGPALPDIPIVPSDMPGVIIEAAFLSNDIDAVWLVQPDSQRLWVQAYALGIQDYFEQHPPSG